MARIPYNIEKRLPSAPFPYKGWDRRGFQYHIGGGSGDWTAYPMAGQPFHSFGTGKPTLKAKTLATMSRELEEKGHRGEASWVIQCGRRFQTRVFGTDDDANYFMELEPGWGIISVLKDTPYRVHVARKDDEGDACFEKNERA